MHTGGAIPQLAAAQPSAPPSLPAVAGAGAATGGAATGGGAQAAALFPGGGFESLSRESARYVPRAVRPPTVRRWLAATFMGLAVASGVLALTARIKEAQVSTDVAAGVLSPSSLEKASDLTLVLLGSTLGFVVAWGWMMFLWQWGTISCARRRYPRSKNRSWKLLLSFIIPLFSLFWPWVLLRRAAGCDDEEPPRWLDAYGLMYLVAGVATQLVAALALESAWNNSVALLFAVAAALWVVTWVCCVLAMYRVDLATSGIAVHATNAGSASVAGAHV